MKAKRKQTHEEYMLERFGLKVGEEYTVAEFDLDGNVVLCTYKVGAPYTRIRCEWKK